MAKPAVAVAGQGLGPLELAGRFGPHPVLGGNREVANSLESGGLTTSSRLLARKLKPIAATGPSYTWPVRLYRRRLRARCPAHPRHQAVMTAKIDAALPVAFGEHRARAPGYNVAVVVDASELAGVKSCWRESAKSVALKRGQRLWGDHSLSCLAGCAAWRLGELRVQADARCRWQSVGCGRQAGVGRPPPVAPR